MTARHRYRKRRHMHVHPEDPLKARLVLLAVVLACLVLLVVLTD